MSRFFAFAGVAAVIVAVAGMLVLVTSRSPGGVGGLPDPSSSGMPSNAAPTTSPAPSMPPLSDAFVSPWYGYRVEYPAGWLVQPGAGPWPLGRNLPHGDPVLDQIMSGPDGAYRARLVGASVALPDGMSMSGFRAFASPQASPCTQVAPLPEPVTVDGAQALVSLNGCHSLSSLGGNIYDILVIAGGRGYDFTLDGDLTPAEATEWLAAITLEPETASPASAAPTP